MLQNKNKCIRRLFSVLFTLSLLFGNLLTLSPVPSSATESPDNPVFQDFDGYADIDAMKTDGRASDKTASAAAGTLDEYSLCSDPRSGRTGNVLKYTTHTTGSNTGVTFGLIGQTMPADATGITFWVMRSGSADFEIHLQALVGNSQEAVRVKWYKKFTAAATTQGEWFQVTARFDEFRQYSDNYHVSPYVNTAVPRSEWDAVTGFRIRSNYSVSLNREFYLDDFAWVFDRVIEDFETSQLGSGADDIKVTLGNYINDGDVMPAAPEITTTQSDRGKSLKIDFGTTLAVKETSDDFQNANGGTAPYIRVEIPVTGKSLSGSSLRTWLRNESDDTITTRMRITDSTGTMYRTSGRNNAPQVTDNTVTPRASVTSYRHVVDFSTAFRKNGTAAPDGMGNWVGTTVIPLTHSMLNGAQKIELYIFPRAGNSGGTLYIDGITVLDPADRVPEGTGSPGTASVSGDDGFVGLTMTSDDIDAALFTLTGTDFYAVNGYIDVPVNYTIKIAQQSSSYLVFDAKVPRKTKLEFTLYDENGVRIGSKSAFAGVIPDGSDNPVRGKVPLSDFGVIPADVKAFTLRIKPANEFNNTSNFLKMGESLFLGGVSFTDSDPGANVPQNSGITAAAPTVPVVKGEFNLPSSTPYKDSGTLYLSKATAPDGELSIKMNGIDFYNEKNYVTLSRVTEGWDMWSVRDTGYVVVDVKAPRDTRIAVTFYDANWSAASVVACVLMSEAGPDGYVRIKMPLYDTFSKTNKDFSSLKGVRLTFSNADFLNSVNFLNVGETVTFRNLKILSDDPGTDIRQNKHAEAKPVPAETQLAAVNASGAAVSGTGWTKTSGEGDLNLKVTDSAFYNAVGSVSLPTNMAAVRAGLEFGYLVFDAKAPRDTMLDLVLSGNGVSTRAQVGIKNAADDFVTFKIPLKDMLLGDPFTVASLTSASLEVNAKFRQDYNFLKPGETISLKNIRFITADAYPQLRQNKDLQPLLKKPSTPEEIEGEDTRLVFRSNAGNTWTDAKNSEAFKSCVSISTVALTRNNEDFKYFAKYEKLTVLDEERFYNQSKNFPWQLKTEIPLVDRDMTPYLETATLRFWARVEKDMDVWMTLTDSSYKGFKIPVHLTAAKDDRFTEYQISLADYNASANTSVNFENIMQIRLSAQTHTPEDYLAKDESIYIAAVEVWSKEALEYDRFADLPSTYRFVSDDGLVGVTAYTGLLPKETTVGVNHYPQSELADWDIKLAPGSTMARFTNVTLYNVNNESFEPSGKIWFSFKVPANADYDRLGLYQVYFDGSKTPLRYVVEGDMISSFQYNTGTFLMVLNDDEYVEAMPKPGDNEQTGGNQTGDEPDGDTDGGTGADTGVQPALWIPLLALPAAALTWTFRKRERRRSI